MLKDTLVAPDGFTVQNWAAGEVRETDDQLGGDLIGAKRAERAKDRDIPVPRSEDGEK